MPASAYPRIIPSASASTSSPVGGGTRSLLAAASSAPSWPSSVERLRSGNHRGGGVNPRDDPPLVLFAGGAAAAPPVAAVLVDAEAARLANFPCWSRSAGSSQLPPLRPLPLYRCTENSSACTMEYRNRACSHGSRACSGAQEFSIFFARCKITATRKITSRSFATNTTTGNNFPALSSCCSGTSPLPCTGSVEGLDGAPDNVVAGGAGPTIRWAAAADEAFVVWIIFWRSAF
mmetsp:Transcript_22912/g.57917  ORF Transcript_22912/g.57917 Transcript_22912/m.57917 type:complete len:233 (+) Transcript_22912:489-1187(+)